MVDMEGYKKIYKDTQTPDDEAEIAASGSRSSGLNVIREEEEGGTQTQLRERQQALKRKARDTADEDQDVEMEDANDGARVAKRRAVEDVNAIKPPARTSSTQASSSTVAAPLSKTGKAAPKSSTKAPSSRSVVGKSQGGGGAEPGQPDKDEAFLKAVATTKRGKKNEDDFDREFNNLRISKPDLQNEAAAEEWAVLDDFDDDTTLRGNFMVVVEMDVYRKGEGSGDVLRVTGGRADWEGRKNFKKFKQVSTRPLLVPHYWLRLHYRKQSASDRSQLSSSLTMTSTARAWESVSAAVVTTCSRLTPLQPPCRILHGCQVSEVHPPDTAKP